MLFVLLRYTDSDYPFSILKLIYDYDMEQLGFKIYLNSIFGIFPGRISDLLFVVIVVKGNRCVAQSSRHNRRRLCFQNPLCKCTMKITMLFFQDIMFCKWLWKVKSKLTASPVTFENIVHDNIIYAVIN